MEVLVVEKLISPQNGKELESETIVFLQNFQFECFVH
jgi:hypothetical protein